MRGDRRQEGVKERGEERKMNCALDLYWTLTYNIFSVHKFIQVPFSTLLIRM